MQPGGSSREAFSATNCTMNVVDNLKCGAKSPLSKMPFAWPELRKTGMNKRIIKLNSSIPTSNSSSPKQIARKKSTQNPD